jgi:hypothetical protein
MAEDGRIQKRKTYTYLYDSNEDDEPEGDWNGVSWVSCAEGDETHSGEPCEHDRRSVPWCVESFVRWIREGRVTK